MATWNVLHRVHALNWSEDEIFEITVAAAIGAALRTFDAGRRKALG